MECMIHFGKRSSVCKYSVSFFIIVNNFFNFSFNVNIFSERDLRPFVFLFIQVFFHGQMLLSFYMSDAKNKCCTARQVGEKISDFSNIPIVKGFLIK